MRIKISFKNMNGFLLSYDYQYSLASMIYHKLSEISPKTAIEQHSTFNLKFYTFSGLIGHNLNTNKGGLSFSEGFLIISSPDRNLITSISEAFLDHPDFSLIGVGGRIIYSVQKVELLKPPIIKKKCTFKTLSPIYVKTVRENNNVKKEVDLYPNEPKFYERLHQNLLKKYEQFYSKKAVDHLDFLKVHDVRTKRIRIEDSYRRCSLMTFTVEGSEELLRFAYDAGLGEKTAMGFGCVDVV